MIPHFCLISFFHLFLKIIYHTQQTGRGMAFISTLSLYFKKKINVCTHIELLNFPPGIRAFKPLNGFNMNVFSFSNIDLSEFHLLSLLAVDALLKNTSKKEFYREMDTLQLSNEVMS